MNYIDDIFERLSIQNLREFLLHGVEERHVSGKSYKARIDEAEKPAIAFIRGKFPDGDEYEKITNKVFGYTTALQDVYMEIGMQCGAVLAAQLLSNGKG